MYRQLCQVQRGICSFPTVRTPRLDLDSVYCRRFPIPFALVLVYGHFNFV